MHQILIAIAVSCVVSATAIAQQPSSGSKEVLPPSHYVIASYFHRTERCPTCKRIGSLTTEAVTKGFPAELQSKAVQVRLIDFQDEKNARLTTYYKIKGPTLILMDVNNGKVTRWMAMPKVWQLVGQPAKFHGYVRQGVKDYLSGKVVAAKAVR